MRPYNDIKYSYFSDYFNIHHKPDDVMSWKRFPYDWLCVKEIQRVTCSFDVSLLLAWMRFWINNRNAGDLRRATLTRRHYKAGCKIVYSSWGIM